jgi:exopolyphosphatase/guanosine-5'-triphosphate,3'-diphosphate pyrophosphatase
MINIKKYAAIDIGSNAMRLLIVNIVEQEGKEPNSIKVLSTCPYPFRTGRLYCWRNLEENIDRMCDAMTAFNL